jgi:hypothetical protein
MQIRKKCKELSTEQCVYITKSSRILTFVEKLKLYEKLLERNIDGFYQSKIQAFLSF